jgi:choice-of-anchor A domain-containing protein
MLQFGNKPTKVGTGGVTGDVGIGPDGKFEISGSSFVTGTLYLSPGATYKKSGPATIGNVVINFDLSQPIADAIAASQADAAMPCSQTYATWNSSRTVTGVVGNNVICVGNVNLGAGSQITLTGPAGAKFIINVPGTFSLGGGSTIRVSGGVTPKDVVYNITGSGKDVQLSGASGVDGSLLAPNRAVEQSGGGITNGQILTGGKLTLSGAAQVICPCQP